MTSTKKHSDMNTTTKTSDTLRLAQQLIARPSVTPDDAGCQQLLGERLQQLGCTLEHLPFGGVSNLWARLGSSEPLLLFAGHTDVVPAGDLKGWKHDPFSARIENGTLYGRGAADMKSSIAAMVCALERVQRSGRQLHGSIAFLFTSDEEGPAVNGTVKVVEALQTRGERANWVIVGEPSSQGNQVDCVRIGRRGSLTGTMTCIGRQGHVAYPDKVRNPIHALANTINQLTQHTWDSGSVDFPATSLQIVSLHSDAGASNVVPGSARCVMNFRFSNQVTEQQLRDTVEAMAKESGLECTFDWVCSAQPFLSKKGDLQQAVADVVKKHSGKEPEFSTGGGTSDGRFLINITEQLVELGPCNATIHQVNEHIDIQSLEHLTDIYHDVIVQLLG